MSRPTKDLESMEFNGWEQLDALIVCSDGLIKNIKTGNFLKPWRMKKGHLQISVSKNGKVKKFLAHRVVANYFCEKTNGCNVVNHLDGNPSNNDYQNLEWTTQQGNALHAKLNGLMSRSTSHYKSVFTDDEILTIHTLKMSHSAIARHYGVSQSVITRIKNFKTYSNYAVIHDK